MQHTVYLFDGFQLDVTRRKLISSGGLVLPLNSRAMEALLLLVGNAGELVEKRRLMQTVWPNAVVEDNNLNQCILAIRKTLGETAGSNRYVMTVPGRGYRFVSPVRVMQQEEEATPGDPGITRSLFSRSSLWVGLAAGALLVSAAVPVAQLIRTHTETTLDEAANVTAGAQPAIVLRLRESPASGDTVAGNPTGALARCLAAHPRMKLRVQVELVPDNGAAPVWSGQYIAGAQDVLALQATGDASSPGCRKLIAAD